MPRKPMNLDGQRFGSLTVEHITDQRNSYGRLLYLCRCDCGNTRLATCFGCPHYPGDEEAYMNANAADFRLPCGQQNC